MTARAVLVYMLEEAERLLLEVMYEHDQDVGSVCSEDEHRYPGDEDECIWCDAHRLLGDIRLMRQRDSAERSAAPLKPIEKGVVLSPGGPGDGSGH